MIVRGALAALARVSKLDAATETVVAARQPALVQTVAYLKGRKYLPPLVYRAAAPFQCAVDGARGLL